MNKIQVVIIYKNYDNPTMVKVIRKHRRTGTYMLPDNTGDMLYEALRDYPMYVSFGKNHIHVIYDLWRKDATRL